MRAARSPSEVGVFTSSRTNRAEMLDTTTLVTSAVFPVTFATAVKSLPSVLTEMLKSRVFHRRGSRPAPAWRTMNRPMVAVAPRSTCRNGAAAVEHHLSRRPPEVEPFTAFSGRSVVRQGAEPVAGLPWVRLLAAHAEPRPATSSPATVARRFPGCWWPASARRGPRSLTQGKPATGCGRLPDHRAAGEGRERLHLGRPARQVVVHSGGAVPAGDCRDDCHPSGGSWCATRARGAGPGGGRRHFSISVTPTAGFSHRCGERDRRSADVTKVVVSNISARLVRLDVKTPTSTATRAARHLRIRGVPG